MWKLKNTLPNNQCVCVCVLAIFFFFSSWFSHGLSPTSLYLWGWPFSQAHHLGLEEPWERMHGFWRKHLAFAVEEPWCVGSVGRFPFAGWGMTLPCKQANRPEERDCPSGWWGLSAYGSRRMRMGMYHDKSCQKLGHCGIERSFCLLSL